MLGQIKIFYNVTDLRAACMAPKTHSTFEIHLIDESLMLSLALDSLNCRL